MIDLQDVYWELIVDSRDGNVLVRTYPNLESDHSTNVLEYQIENKDLLESFIHKAIRIKSTQDATNTGE